MTKISLATGYVRWPDGTAQAVEVADDERVYIEGQGPFTFTQILTERKGMLCLER